MKIETSKQNSETIENTNIQLTEQDKEMLSACNMPFSEMLAQQINTTNNNFNVNDLNSLSVDYNYDTLTMTEEDAKFFVNLTQNAQFTVTPAPNGEFTQIIETQLNQNLISTKAIEVTNKITELIDKAQKTQKPVRITLDNDVSVILKIDKDGKVTAEFIPGSLEVENYLRNNIASLKQKFDEQNLPYNDLFYRQSNKENNKNRNNNKNKGDK